MRPLRWMSIAAVDGTCVLMDEDHRTMMVLGFSTDALMDVVNNVDVFDDVEVDGAEGGLKKVRVLMHIGADVLLLNDVHVELEDADHDVIPLSASRSG